MLYSICLLVLVLSFCGGQTQECNRCSNGFTYFPTEKKCYFVIPALATWDEAFNTCNHLGAHLAVVKDAETNAALRTAFIPFKGLCPNDFGRVNNGSAFWTAGRYPCKNTPPFKWSTGSGNLLDIEYYNWRNGEPSNGGGNEDCIHMIDEGKDVFVYNDIRCSRRYCTICEIDI